MDSVDISRRRTLSSLGATGALALAGCVGDGDDDGTEDTENGTTEDSFEGLRIGIIGAFTGPNGPEFGHQGLTGFLSGLAYKNGDEVPPTNQALDIANVAPVQSIVGQTIEYTVNGTPLELYVRDTRDDPDGASLAATNLIVEEDVDMLYGVSNSDSLLRVIRDVVKPSQVPLFVGQASTTEATANDDTCSDYLFRASETAAMSARTGAQFVVENESLNKAALFGADYSFGRNVINNYETVFERGDVEVVSRQIVPRGFSDFHPLLWQIDGTQDHPEDQYSEEELQQLEEMGVYSPQGNKTCEEWDWCREKKAPADVIIYGMTTQTGVPFFRAYTTDLFGEVRPRPVQVIGDMGSRLVLSRLGSSIEARVQNLNEGSGGGITLAFALNLVNFGPLSVRYFWNQYENEINDAFITGQRQAYSVNPDLFSCSGFASASAIVQAIEDAEGEVSADAIVEGVPGMTVQDTPKGEGEYVFQEYNNQARSPMTMAQIQVSPPNEEYSDDTTYETEDEFWPPILKVSEPVDLQGNPTKPIGADGDGEPFVADKDDITLKADEVTCDLTSG